jgi:hypothetical protein
MSLTVRRYRAHLANRCCLCGDKPDAAPCAGCLAHLCEGCDKGAPLARHSAHDHLKKSEVTHA